MQGLNGWVWSGMHVGDDDSVHLGILRPVMRICCIFPGVLAWGWNDGEEFSGRGLHFLA